MMGVLRYLNDLGEEMFPMDRKSVWRNLYGMSGYNETEYFPSEIERTASKLERKGWVEKRMTDKGLQVTITEAGRKQVLLFLLDEMKPKTGEWDGKWRVVFFDVPDSQRKKRDKLRSLLKSLGFYEMQKSVYINPFDYTTEMKYIREALDIPHGVKLAVMEEMENAEELKEIFKLK